MLIIFCDPLRNKQNLITAWLELCQYTQTENWLLHIFFKTSILATDTKHRPFWLIPLHFYWAFGFLLPSYWPQGCDICSRSPAGLSLLPHAPWTNKPMVDRGYGASSHMLPAGLSHRRKCVCVWGELSGIEKFPPSLWPQLFSQAPHKPFLSLHQFRSVA